MDISSASSCFVYCSQTLHNANGDKQTINYKMDISAKAMLRLLIKKKSTDIYMDESL